MAISDSEKVDLLFKKLAFGVTKTASATNKAGSNETIASPLPVYANNIWTKANLIPAVAPASTSPVVSVLVGANRVQMTNDTTATPNLTWLANMTDFIPASFGSSYAVKAYIGNPAGSKAARIFPDTSGEEYVFDYNAGVLNFIGGIPGTKTASIGSGSVSLSTDGLYIEVYQYVGGKGVAAAGTTSKNNVVADIPARDALTGLATGDTVYVIDASGIPGDAGPGEWAMYMWTGSAFTCISTQDSARSDALTGSLDITPATASTILGRIGNGARVVEISVTVTTAFDGNYDITVGDSVDSARLLNTDLVDMSTVGTYVVTPTYRFPSASETNLILTVIGTATVGAATVCFTYA